jgi:hypothetical protein
MQWAPVWLADPGTCQPRSVLQHHSRISVARSPLAGRTANGRSERAGSLFPPTPRPTRWDPAAGPPWRPLSALRAWSCIPPSRRCSSSPLRLRRGRCLVSLPCAHPPLASDSSVASTGPLSPVRSLVSAPQRLERKLARPPRRLLHPLQLLAAVLCRIRLHLGNSTPSVAHWSASVAPSS